MQKKLSESSKTKNNIFRSKKSRSFWALIIVVVMIPLIWAIGYVIQIYTYPDARNSSRHKNYDFTRIYNVKRTRNELSGINLGCSLKDLNDNDWGLIPEEYDFDAVRDAGFYHVRVPVQFLPHLNISGDTYQIDQNLLTCLD